MLSVIVDQDSVSPLAHELRHAHMMHIPIVHSVGTTSALETPHVSVSHSVPQHVPSLIMVVPARWEMTRSIADGHQINCPTCLFLWDRVNGTQYLVDTRAAISVLPPTA